MKKICCISLILIICISESCKNQRENISDNGSAPIPKDKIRIFAAAGLSEPLDELIDSFEIHYNTVIQINYASSGTLARQIEQSEVPDLYISAHKKWIFYLDSLNYIQKGTMVDIVKDKLVLISPEDSKINHVLIDSNLNLKKILGVGRLSMGDPDHVPAGEYARQALIYFNLWPEVKSQILPAKDVRSAVMVVELAEAPLGIAYYTVAARSEKIIILGEFPEHSHKPIVFSAGICTNKPVNRRFIDYLLSDSADVVWNKFGFSKP